MNFSINLGNTVDILPVFFERSESPPPLSPWTPGLTVSFWAMACTTTGIMSGHLVTNCTRAEPSIESFNGKLGRRYNGWQGLLQHHILYGTTYTYLILTNIPYTKQHIIYIPYTEEHIRYIPYSEVYLQTLYGRTYFTGRTYATITYAWWIYCTYLIRRTYLIRKNFLDHGDKVVFELDRIGYEEGVPLA